MSQKETLAFCRRNYILTDFSSYEPPVHQNSRDERQTHAVSVLHIVSLSLKPVLNRTFSKCSTGTPTQ